MNNNSPVQWTDARVVALLLLPIIASITAVAGSAANQAGPNRRPIAAATERPSVMIPTLAEQSIDETDEHHGATEIGTAMWAIALLNDLDTYAGPPPEKYDRDTYDVGWLDLDGDCQSGRHELLIAQSVAAVELDAAGCKVIRGLWFDPYAGHEIRTAQGASIDHVVSLADAHRSGGWQWSHDWRVAFANDLDDPATLAVVATQVNSSNGSGAPDHWMPAGEDERCAYAIAWVRVKTRWQLAVTESERDALDEALHRCDERGQPDEIESAPLRIVDFAKTPFLPVDRESGGGAAPGSDVCDVRYEAVCVPAVVGDLDCGDIEPRRFEVTVDPHNFDGDGDGIACER